MNSSAVYPVNLTKIYNEDLRKRSYDEILFSCGFVDLSVSETQISHLEHVTRKQYKSKLWFDFRAGRITASLFYDACHTSQQNPSKSLLSKICYPMKTKFSSPALDWGIKHEKTAKQCYISSFKQSHVNFCVRDTGFRISHVNPRFGATPDGFVHCTCCGSGVIEVKCPFSSREKDSLEVGYL